jgi:hypothetical protein
MIMKRGILQLMLSLCTSAIFACSCFGPETFCGTLDPPYPEPQWWIPDAIVLGVKTAQSDHGMDVEVIEPIAGAPQAGEILRVWGDCGLLCRIYPDAWEIGDTVIWAFKYTDLAGNALCGTSLEQEGDLMISACGVYYLSYQNGSVSGPIDQGITQLPYEDFLQYIVTCGATGMIEVAEEPMVEAILTGEQLNVRVNGFRKDTEYHLADMQGAMVANGPIVSDLTAIPIGRQSTGVYLLRISDGHHRKTIRVFLP